jgi:hypothetical protein
MAYASRYGLWLPNEGEVDTHIFMKRTVKMAMTEEVTYGLVQNLKQSGGPGIPHIN